ncbi:uncharacterized protein PV06_00277 [Exophiala oligosperma]|uniref:Uncharacterized protein n=1 Tax=Exophiala oligosperma TaxID=215243 RepID=A0A0D2EI16_9EURO|nr:uncharacterized protein PV06_00277 [Exophiala oligosperma]KIW47594.1 hypothetical protein PV06_00277 [Exophiala oligosperma]
MLQYLLLIILAVATTPTVRSLANPLPQQHRRDDTTFPCPAVDQWVKVNTYWIRTSTSTGCMALELNTSNIYALNALPKPVYTSKLYPNLVCSLCTNECDWTYSPLDPVGSGGPAPESNVNNAEA